MRCRVLKNMTAKLLFKKFPDLEEELLGGYFYSEDEHIDTLGENYDTKPGGIILKNRVSLS